MYTALRCVDFSIQLSKVMVKNISRAP